MQKEKCGFVYIWFDRKYKRYYIGAHWGREDDGYICSSTWMRNSYKRRPQDFKRRIVSLVYTNKKDMFEIEFKWLKFIKKQELGKKYYNHHNFNNNHWSGKSQQEINEIIKKFKQSSLGRKLTESHKKKIGYTSKGRTHTKETKEKMSKIHLGKKFSLEAKEKMRIYSKNRSKEHLQKLSLSKLGKTQSEETIKKRTESNSRIYKITFLDKSSIVIKNLTKYCRENNLSHASVWYNMNSNRRYKDLIIEPITGEDLF